MHVHLSPAQVKTLTGLVRDSRSDDTELLEALTRPQLVVLNRLDAAFDLWNECLSDTMLMSHLAPKLTCREANIFAEFIDAFGGEVSAQAFLDFHAQSDSEDDLHYERRDTNPAN